MDFGAPTSSPETLNSQPYPTSRAQTVNLRLYLKPSSLLPPPAPALTIYFGGFLFSGGREAGPDSRGQQTVGQNRMTGKRVVVGVVACVACLAALLNTRTSGLLTFGWRTELLSGESSSVKGARQGQAVRQATSELRRQVLARAAFEGGGGHPCAWCCFSEDSFWGRRDA